MDSVNDTLSTIFDSNDSKWKPSDKIPLLTKEIEITKSNLKEFLDNSDYDVTAILQESNELFDEAKALTRDLELCEQEIEQVTMAEVLQSIENHNHIAKEIQSYTYALNIVKDVIESSKHVKKFSAGRAARSYSVVTEAIHSLLSLIENSSEGFQELEYCQNLKQDVPTILSSTLQEMHSEWRRMVQWQVTPDPSKTIVTLKISFKPIDIAVDILSTLDTCESKLQELVRELGSLILEEILVPIIHKECTVYSETEMDELVTVTIFHLDNFKPTYDAVIANLRLFFHYLNNRLNIEFKKDTNIMKILGKEIYKEFSEILVRHCFIDTIPNNITDLQIYGRITSEIQCFQDFLVSMKFFPEENFSILQYVENIDTLFADKSSEHFLNEARLIMFQDLSSTMSIGVENIPEENNDNSKDAIETDEQTEEALKVLDETIPKSLFYFPRCMISKSTQELLDLVYGIMEQAVQCSDVVSKKLYNTTRLVFELYDAVVPYHHENYLQTIPHYVALFHNNCMYLAHNLQTFGDKWLILMEGRELDYPISFLDLVPKLRDLGYKHLMIHMQQQRKQILDNIRSSDLNCIVVKDVLGDNAEAAVRQCLRQLQLLKNVWIGVFPSNVFLRLMSTLVNMFVDELIHRVCTVEDISMEMATQLSDMYTLVVQKAPQLFQSPEAIETHVSSWEKLQQLIFVLGGSLRDIESHWNDGKGPLAVHFKIEELRSLIKALFQNTQFRSNLLSKIKQ